MALVSQVENTTYDGCTLTVVIDDSIYDAASDSFQTVSASGSNPTGANGFPARDLIVWAIFKGNRIQTVVKPGQTQTWTPKGNRSAADVSEYGLS